LDLLRRQLRSSCGCAGFRCGRRIRVTHIRFST
jgi:hypothetical protein